MFNENLVDLITDALSDRPPHEIGMHLAHVDTSNLDVPCGGEKFIFCCNFYC